MFSYCLEFQLLFYWIHYWYSSVSCSFLGVKEIMSRLCSSSSDYNFPSENPSTGSVNTITLPSTREISRQESLVGRSINRTTFNFSDRTSATRASYGNYRTSRFQYGRGRSLYETGDRMRATVFAKYDVGNVDTRTQYSHMRRRHAADAKYKKPFEFTVEDDMKYVPKYISLESNDPSYTRFKVPL